MYRDRFLWAVLYFFLNQKLKYLHNWFHFLHSGCPEECRVAVSSLMFAAARFSDLPELRDLRQIFQERYGNSLDCYVNQEVTIVFLDLLELCILMYSDFLH